MHTRKTRVKYTSKLSKTTYLQTITRANFHDLYKLGQATELGNRLSVS